ncbi:MAG: hypothetical protein AAB499_02785 [Patescibacteria group bacterium]
MSEEPTKNTTPAAPTKDKSRGGCRGCLKGCLVVVVVLIALIVGGVLTANYQPSDKKVLSSYQPTAEMADISTKNSLTDKGKATFYRAKPRFITGEEFRPICVADGVEGLACTDGRNIYMLQIDDPEFIDHKYSAAVHEMLHVAYRRLDKEEKARLNALLDQELTKHQDDYHLTGIVDDLKAKKTDAAEAVLGELHSKFGVEYSTLMPEL